MPLAQIQLFEGRGEEIKESLIRNVSGIIATTLEIPIEHVTVILTDVPKSHWGEGGIPFSKK